MDSYAESAGQPLPITVGRLLDFPEDPVACMRKLHRTHGNLAVLQEESQRLVFVFGSELNQRVLADSQTFHSRFFAIRGPKKSAQRRLTSGLLSMNGQEHKQHRRIVMGPFQKKMIAGFHESIVQLTQEMLETWQPGEVRDIHQEMTEFMLRLTSALLFGVDQPEFAVQVGEMIDRWVEMNHVMGIGAFISDPQFTERYDRLLAFAEELEADIRQMIELRRSSPEQGQDVLSLLIRAHENEGGTVDDAQLVGHTALLFGAAHLTTAHTFTWTLFLLAQHPSVMQELHDELQSQVSDSAPTLEELATIPVMERVIKESMRVLPASGYSQRMNAEPVELGPLRLPVGTPVIFSQFITQHMPELFPDPDAFTPDRWLKISPSPYAYLPFGAGPRMCIGAPMAMMILKTALPTILKRFKVSAIAGSEISGGITSTMLAPSGPVPMRVSEQDGRFESAWVGGNIHSLVELREMPAHSDNSRRAA